MAISVVQSATEILVDAGGHTATISFASLPTNGHGIIIPFATGVAENPTLDPVIADNQGNTFTKAISRTETSAGQMAAIWYLPAVGATSGTYTVTFTWHALTNNYDLGGMQEASSGITIDTTAFTNTQVAGVTTITGSALAIADELVFCAYTEDSSGSGASTLSADVSYTNSFNEANSGAHIAGSGDFKAVAVATAPTCVYTSSNAPTAVVGVMATFKAAAAGATTTKGRAALLGVGM